MSILLVKMEQKHLEKGDGQRIKLMLKDPAGIAASLDSQLPEGLEDRQHTIYAVRQCADALGAHLSDASHIFVFYDGSNKGSMKRANFVAAGKPKSGASGKKAARAYVSSMFVLASVWKKPFTDGDWQFSLPGKYKQYRLSHKHAIEDAISQSMKGDLASRREDAAVRLHDAMSNEVA